MRFSPIVPQTEMEQERFYLEVIEKLVNTNITLAELEQRADYPAAATNSELERTVRSIISAVQSPLRSQIADLERRINSIEKSARF